MLKQVYRIGNLTLLESKINREIGNQLFPAKVVESAKSRYLLAQNTAADSPEEWTIAQIDARQKILAARAVHIWRSDFA